MMAQKACKESNVDCTKGNPPYQQKKRKGNPPLTGSVGVKIFLI
jgi:hypothetical protein